MTHQGRAPCTVTGVFIGSGRSRSRLTCTIATARRAVTSLPSKQDKAFSMRGVSRTHGLHSVCSRATARTKDCSLL